MGVFRGVGSLILNFIHSHLIGSEVGIEQLGNMGVVIEISSLVHKIFQTLHTAFYFSI